jgi:hypothetical protein
LLLAVYLKTRPLANCTGISFVDSMPIRACHIKRKQTNKVLKGLFTEGIQLIKY